MNAHAVLLLVVALALPACISDEDSLYPHDPPPNLPPGITLLELPQAAVESLTMPRVADELAKLLIGQELGLDRPTLPPERRDDVLAHRVVTGMTVREVVFCFLSDPSRQRHQGPPGGTVLIWEPRDRRLASYWVRFDENGRSADAGTN
jgi:hypothetical protein